MARRTGVLCGPSAEVTDWSEIVGLYDVLLRVDPSPVIELNRAVAVAMRDGPSAGLALIDAILARGDLQDYRLAHAARADMYRRLDRTEQAGPSLPSRTGECEIDSLGPPCLHGAGARAERYGRPACKRMFFLGLGS